MGFRTAIAISLIIFFRPTLITAQVESFELGWQQDSATGNLEGICDRLYGGQVLPNTVDQLPYYKRGLDLLDMWDIRADSILAEVHFWHGFDLGWIDRPGEALPYLMRALQHYRAFLPDTAYKVHATQFHIAEKNFHTRNWRECAAFIDSSLSTQRMCEKTGNWPRTLNLWAQLAARHGQVGSVEALIRIVDYYRQQLPEDDDELNYLDSRTNMFRWLDLPERILDVTKPFLSDPAYATWVHDARGQAMLMKLDYPAAIEELEACLSLGLDARYIKDNLAHAYSHLGRHDEAIDHTRLILAQARQPDERFVAYINAAQTFYNGGHLDSSLYYNNLAGRQLRELDDLQAVDLARYGINRIRQINDSGLWKSLTAQESRDLITWINQTHEQLATQRLGVLDAGGRANFSRQARDFYDQAILLHSRYHALDGQVSHIDQIIRYMESVRALVAKEEFLRNRGGGQQDISERIKRDQWLGQLGKGETGDQIADSIIVSLLAESRRKEVVELPIIGIAGLPEDRQVLEYFVHEDTSLTIVHAGKDSRALLRVSSDRWWTLLHTCLAALDSAVAGQAWNQQLQRLHHAIVPELQDDLPLLIVPDHVLSYLPFEALRNQQGAYLGQTHDLCYGFSLDLWHRARTAKSRPGDAYFFAPWTKEKPAIKTDKHDYAQPGSLPFSQSEVEGIQEFLDEGHLFAEADATRKVFLKVASRASLLHLSTHAVAARTDTVEPKILFEGGANGQAVLQRDLFHLNVPAEMIVMSACETGLGGFQIGEGVMSFARAFTAAGAKSVIASLWAVNDQSTAEIMVNFYRHLKDGKRKDTALRLAKEDYLAQADARYQHPYYWAGFVAIGDMSPLKFGAAKMPWNGYVIALVIILGLLFSAQKIWSRVPNPA